MVRTSLALVVSLGLVVGCAAPAAETGEGTGSVEQAALSWNGVGLNAAYLNAMGMNGLGFNGLSWNGVGWNGAMWNGALMNGSIWNGAIWNGIGWNASAWNGGYLNGFGWNGPVFNGTQINGLQVNGVQVNAGFMNAQYLNAGFLNAGYLNTGYFNGARWDNGVMMQGRALDMLQGVSFEAIQLDRVGLRDVALRGSTFVGTRDGAYVEGDAFVGAVMIGKTLRGLAVPMRIESIVDAKVPAAAVDIGNKTVSIDANDVQRYFVSVPVSVELRTECDATGCHPGPRVQWANMCGVTADGAPIAAIPLDGTWDYATGGKNADGGRAFTWACETAVLAKCVRAGYRPWATVKGAGGEAVSLADHHQACTRMMRADYCGDGHPNTENGTPINIVDFVGIQADTEAWTHEASWGPSGATCLASTRWQTLLVDGHITEPLEYVKTHCPTKLTASCDGALLRSEHQPR